MANTRLAVQLFTLRDHCKTEADFIATCKRLKAMGWDAVQVSAIGVHDATVVRQILDDAGLVCCVTHQRPAEAIWESPQTVIDDLNTLGCDYTAVGGYFPKGEDFNEANWHAWIARYNDAAKHYQGTGKRIGYHNHSHEFAKLGGKDDYQSRTAMDLLESELSHDVWFEVDTYWVAHGGGDPAAWIRKFKNRCPVIHVKDMAVTTDRTPYMAEVGVGNLDWPGILAACEEAGVEWYAVEQDTVYRDPFDSLETSLKNLQAMGLK
jgi:sugar phosphate isomerase/epimerase